MIKARKTVEVAGVAPFAHLRGLGFALTLTALLLVLIGFLVSATGLTESAARWLTVAGGGIALLLGSSQTGRRMGKAGWLNGGITGLCYVLVLLVLALLLDLTLSARSLVTLAAGFTIGAAGGVLGVNRR